MKQRLQKIAIVTFLILVAFLSLFFTYFWTNSLFGENGGWAMREGILDKLTIFIFYADMPLLSAASITSIISFFKRPDIPFFIPKIFATLPHKPRITPTKEEFIVLVGPPD
jgi:hypothetical protein